MQAEADLAKADRDRSRDLATRKVISQAELDAGRSVIASESGTVASPDPVLVVTLPKDGPFFLSVIDANDLGGGNFHYRLVVRPEK